MTDLERYEKAERYAALGRAALIEVVRRYFDCSDDEAIAYARALVDAVFADDFEYPGVSPVASFLADADPDR